MTWFRTHRFELLFALAFVLLLAPLLLPGYILTLDMVFTPLLPLPQVVEGGYRNGWAIRVVLHALTLVVPGWIVQKGVFVALFGVIATCAYRFVMPPASRSTKTLVALFAVFNPFVYTRFLAGQWTILLAYGLLPLVFAFADQREEEGAEPAWKRGTKLGFALAGVFAGSLHVGVMAMAVVAAQVFGTATRAARTVRVLLAAMLAFVVATSYWTIPALTRSSASVIDSFDARHLTAFATVARPGVGLLGTVLALGGFWGEREPWGASFLWAQETSWLWALASGVLAIALFVGVVLAMRDRARRRQTFVLLAFGACVVIASMGMAESLVQPVNAWLFAEVPFWRGFRDTQKWSAVLVLLYAWALASVSERRKRVGRVVLALAMFAFTYPVLGGFWGQLKPVWFPPAWAEANALFQEDPDCKALFLPWHLYYVPSWNRERLVANPAPAYFACDMVVSRNVELGAIRTQGAIDPAYDAIDGVVTGRDGLTPEQSLEVLRAAGIRFILVTETEESGAYPFLGLLPKKLHTGGVLTVYSLVE